MENTGRRHGKLAELLHETGLHHDPYEKSHAAHNWWDWYAAYFNARQNGRNSDEASVEAKQYMDEVHKIPSL